MAGRQATAHRRRRRHRDQRRRLRPGRRPGPARRRPRRGRRRQGLALHRLGDHHAAAQLAAETLDLWRGEALADSRDFDFAQPAIARLDDTRVALRQLQLAAELELGRAESAVPQLQALSREHPDREEVWRLLMLGLYRAGRQADALDAYRTARERLDETMGVEPSAALRDLYTAILNQDPTLDADAAARRPLRSRSRRPLPTPRRPGRTRR